VYGAAYHDILAIQEAQNNFATLHPRLPYLQAEVIYQVQQEQAKTIEDVLARRTRALFLDAKAAIDAAPLVAKLMAAELKKDQAWVEQELQTFHAIAKTFLVVL